MKVGQVNLVKNFVKANAARMEKVQGSAPARPIFNLYDKNSRYIGEHSFHSFVDGKVWHTLIRGKNIKPKAQEIVCVQRNEVWIHPKTEEEIINTKKLATEITTTTTVLDHDNDKFITTRKVCKLMNKLEKVNPDDPNCVMHGAYKPIEKPRYITCVDEVINEGSISKVNESIMSSEITGEHPGALTPRWVLPINTKTSPGKFWYRSGK